MSGEEMFVPAKDFHMQLTNTPKLLHTPPCQSPGHHTSHLAEALPVLTLAPSFFLCTIDATNVICCINTRPRLDVYLYFFSAAVTSFPIFFGKNPHL